jgi:prepilin peptidase CpaA
MTIPFAAVGILLLAAFYTDLKSMIIPNLLTVSFLAGGCLFALISDGWPGLFLSK